ncbi:MAG: hypothetical protein RBJ76_25490 [Stenomitos frigidus ULC029]
MDEGLRRLRSIAIQQSATIAVNTLPQLHPTGKLLFTAIAVE